MGAAGLHPQVRRTVLVSVMVLCACVRVCVSQQLALVMMPACRPLLNCSRPVFPLGWWGRVLKGLGSVLRSREASASPRFLSPPLVKLEARLGLSFQHCIWGLAVSA